MLNAPRTFELPYVGDAPYINQYFGIWAIQEEALQAHVEFARNLNLQVHLNSEQAAQARAAGQSADSTVSDRSQGQTLLVRLWRRGFAAFQLANLIA